MTLEQKYLGQIIDSISTNSRKSQMLSFVSHVQGSDPLDVIDKSPDQNFLFSQIDEQLSRRRSSVNLKRLTLGVNKKDDNQFLFLDTNANKKQLKASESILSKNKLPILTKSKRKEKGNARNSLTLKGCTS
jgi:hypothetical protein